MNAFEEFNFGDKYILRFYRVDNALICNINESMVPELREVEAMLRQQQAEINQQQDEKKALYNLVAEQDKKIVELAFKLAYAERGNEIVLEVNTRSRP